MARAHRREVGGLRGEDGEAPGDDAARRVQRRMSASPIAVDDEDTWPDAIHRSFEDHLDLLRAYETERKTAEEAWRARPVVSVDRVALVEEVNDRARRIRESKGLERAPEGTAERWAIEWALESRGYLRREHGRTC
jgi:hypothetical protein